ncbi:toll/interleukin-1 receptor domain-containing protein [Nitrososphaera sp.]|uniref:toll/interleukin-1 receptor domain-containing protein n=1 Tax=Nitrososphaera sp. TaxID=1971748 RepID=UPI001813DF80|nr:toll/interleukin-1 receptor domain-containing protein [Nitrososphaera sp.]NWG36706.1 toll/interleukin-1 receptor domain-containing protein [Nitrososphaera sp.]
MRKSAATATPQGSSSEADTPDVFLSYQHDDEEWVGKLAAKVEKETLNGRHLKTWFAPWDIQPGDNIVLKIEDGLRKARFFAPVMTPEWSASAWANLERTMATFSDPLGIKRKIVPIYLRECEIPLSLQGTLWLDFRSESNYARETKKLIALLKGESLRPRPGGVNEPSPKPSLLSVAPDQQEELIVSNLLPVTNMPQQLFLAKTTLRKRGDVWDIIPNTNPPPFAFDDKDQTILSFANPQTNELKQILASTQVKKVTLEQCIANLPVTLVDLLNRCNTRHTQSLGLYYDYRSMKKNFFVPDSKATKYYKDGKIITNDTGKDSRRLGRTLVKYVESIEPFYVHRSCKTGFTIVGKSIYFKIVPGWHFTTNGTDPVDRRKMSSLSAQWMNRERNHAVLDDLRLWTRIYAREADSIAMDVGVTEPITIATTPLLAKLEVGIFGDYRDGIWEKESATDEEIEELEENIDADAEQAMQSTDAGLEDDSVEEDEE